jgi:RsiW-degrading membrane proteinase PrsW (M82 family)
LRWWIAFLGGRGRVILAVQLLVVALATLAGGVFAQRIVPGDTPLARAEALMRTRQLGKAEALLWHELSTGPVTVPLLVLFLDEHNTQRVLLAEGLGVRGESFLLPEEAVDALFLREGVGEDVAVIGRFWRGVLAKDVPPDLRARMLAIAALEPPKPFANRMLAREAHREGHLADAAARYEREGLAFADHREDMAEAMNLLALTDAWDEIGVRVLDPRVRDRVPPQIRYAYAVRVKNARLALHAILATALLPRPLGPLALASISGFMWLLFAFRLGRVAERPKVRFPLYLAALVLGVLSVLPTLVAVGLEESLFHFRERGDLVSDLIFFTVGVGLREELCKLLLFLPLLPFLRKHGTRLDVLACGALIGLGFASEENVQYLQAGLATALSRFLTANFLHMALTAVLALSLYDLVRDPEEGAPAFSRTLLTVVAMHGAYDFFLSNGSVEGLSFLSMTIFVLLTRMFMTEVRRARTGPGLPLLPRFAQAVVIVTCASFVYASAFVGPAAAAFVLAQGMLGVLLIVFMFVQEIRRA